MQYQNIWIRSLEDAITPLMITLDLNVNFIQLKLISRFIYKYYFQERETNNNIYN